MNTIIYLILSLVLGFLITSAVTPYMICLAFKKEWFDTLDTRKIHHGLIPRIGGMAFVPSALVAFVLTFAASTYLGDLTFGGDISHQLPLSSIVCSFIALWIIYAEGMFDDVKGAGYKIKFLIHFLCALLIVSSGIWVNNFYGLFGLYELPWYFGMPFTVLLIMYIINAINLIDGIDGLCSGLSIVAFMFLGTMFFFEGQLSETLLSMSMLGALIAYFAFNVYGTVERHTKIFMGDCGSQVLGLLLSMLVVRLAMHGGEVTHASHSIIVALAPMVVPCLDVIRVMIGRISRGANPFLPDKTHIHHLLLAKGWSQRKSRTFIILIAIFFIGFNCMLDGKININLIFLADIALYLILQTWISHTLKKVKA